MRQGPFDVTGVRPLTGGCGAGSRGGGDFLGRTQGTHAPGVVLEHSPAVAQERQYGCDVFGAAPAQEGRCLPRHGAPDNGGFGPRAVSQLHMYPPPVGIVADAPYVSPPLETVDEGRRRSARQTDLIRQVTGGDPFPAFDDVERAPVAAVDAEPGAGGLVEEVLCQLMTPHLARELSSQYVRRKVA